ncbi:opioid growth factor receptor-like protein 1 isoform X3 [Ruditapes philippinarum]|uniref:opioid growth factor receptor-like protein 1 isoform X3 n=1 Tax=Ruditapes philippinarum TaxID=129788 RepID=UPI00295BA8CD|nr:opioid growth factor receptor-like protein 1 isoform X3 [Ruditapes philippinarum]
MNEESLHQGDEQFQQKIDTISDDVANERGGNVSHQSQTKVDKYKKENETPKENTSMHDESCDELQFQLKTDTMPDDFANEKDGNVLHQSQTKVHKNKKENETLKENTSMNEEIHQGDEQFQQKIDTISDDVANEKGGNVSHQSQTKVHKYEKENEALKEKISMHEESCNELQFQLNTDTMPDDIANEKDGNVLHQSQTKSKCAENDIQQYLDGYPDQEDDLMREENYKFFMDEIPSRPNGDYIDTIHNEWWGDYKRLEDNRKYMQWLFPVRAKSCNRQAQELFPHEIKKICDCKEAQDRLILSYKMMLDFYGMQLENEKDGTVVRSDNWEERFANLNRSKHNHNRITRILKCLGELGFEHLKKNFIEFILVEILETKTLVYLQESCCNYWIAILKDPSERAEMRVFYEQLIKNMSDSLT